MNRKLLNGLLVLAVAAGGVGTFTSCKDDNYVHDLRNTDEALQAQIAALRGITDQQFYNKLHELFEEWVQVVQGQPGPQGPQGEQGEQGQPGKDGITPVFKIENGDLWVSYDDGKTWTDLGRVVGNDGNDGQPGTPGQPGSGDGGSCLCDWLNSANIYTQNFSGAYQWTYEQFVNNSVAMWDLWQNIKRENYNDPNVNEYVNALYNMMLENIFPGEQWFQAITYNRDWIYLLDQRPTSISLSQTFNPVFGAVNLPVGISSTILATYKYKSENGAYNFPGDLASYADVFPEPDTHPGIYYNESSLQVIKSLNPSSYALPDYGVVEFSAAQEFGNMGGAIVTINPADIDFSRNYNVSLVSSTGQEVVTSKDGGIELEKFSGELFFGATRAAESTGLYSVNVNANENNYAKMSIDVEKSEIGTTLKNAIKDKSIGDAAKLAKTLFEAVNNQLPAYAVKYSWTENQPVMEEDGDFYTSATNTVVKSVVSDYNLAAVVLHPLSYATNLDRVVPGGKSLPIVHSALADYFDKIDNKLHLDFSDVEGINPDDVNFDLQVEIRDGLVYAFDESGKVIGTFPYNADGITASDKDLDSLTDAILDAVGAELSDQVRKQIINQINDAIDDINDALASVEGKVEDLRDIVDRVKDSRLLTYGQKLVDVYNKLAERANKFLAYPDYYIQAVVAYSAGDGPRFLSNDIYAPTKVSLSSLSASASGKKGITLYTTSFTGDILVPSFKKYVAITGVVENGTVNTTNVAQYNNAEGLNEVYEGHQEIFGLDLTNLAGKTVRLTYVSVDYHGVCSMEDCYIKVNP